MPFFLRNKLWWVEFRRKLRRALLYLWGTVILDIAINGIANFSTMPTDTPLSKLLLIHLAVTYPVPVFACLSFLGLLTFISWTGGSGNKTSSTVFRDQQNRVRMLLRLRHAYTDLTSQSLQGAARLELGIASKPDTVQNATNLLLRMESRVEQPLPPGTSITEAYDKAEHELLILGEPGAGKSTLLLDLAEHLVERAKTDETHPLPVILPLSSWATKRPRLEDWIAEQVSEIYDVPRKVSVQWVQEDSILPLLDGLDEMEEEARPACIAAINAYHRDHMLIPLVVCSRITEYKAASERQRLALAGAVVVQPLTREHVDASLAQVGKPLAALRNALKKNEALQHLSSSPLMLNVLILTYRGTSVRSLSTKGNLLHQQVWNDYLQRMVARKGNSKCYPLEQTRDRLSYLAQQMRTHNEAVFYLEHLQPDWLMDKQRHTYTWLGIRLPALVIGVLISILVQLFFFLGANLTDLPLLLQYGVLGGLLGELWYGPASAKGSQGEYRYAWGKRLIKRLAISVCIGLVSGLSFGFYYIGPYYYTRHDWLIHGLSYGIVMVLVSLLLQYLLAVPFYPSAFPGNSVSRRETRIAGFLRAIQGPRALLVTVIIWLSNGLSIGLSNGLSVGLSNGLINGLSFGLSIGLSYALISLALSIQMENIRLTERVRWTWRGLFTFRHLGITVLLTCITTVLVGLSTGLSLGLGTGLSVGASTGLDFGLSNGLGTGLSVGLSVGLSYWFLIGLYQGIAQERIENQDRYVANQGIHRSLHNSLAMSIIGVGMIGCIGILSYGLKRGLYGGLSYMVNEWQIYMLSEGLRSVLSTGLRYILSDGWSYILSEGLFYGSLMGISGALLIFILTGGLATWRHYVIRYLLWRSRTLPWQVSQFLDDAVARCLLRRVGGGYSFSHRLLLDHLADVETGATPSTHVSVGRP